MSVKMLKKKVLFSHTSF